MTRYAVVGSRRFPDPRIMWPVLRNFIHTGDVLVSGGAQGPDTWGAYWAKQNHIEARVFEAKWDEPCHANCQTRDNGYGPYYPHSGLVRNQLIVDDSDVVLAFVMPDRSGGTEDTIKKALKANKHVFCYLPDGSETAP